MPNRYGDGTDGNDWWSANDPGQLHPYEQGGITGNAAPGPLQAAAPAGLPPLTGTPPNASGDQTKIQLPNGQWVRVGFGEGHPVWVPQTNAQGSGGGAYTGPGAIPPPFQAPSMQDLQNEPGYQARYQMGLQGLERGAAAQGSILSGGTQKALARYGQDYASNEYSNAYNRALQTYNTNWQTQSLDPWARFRDLYQGGLSAIGTSKTQTPVFAS